MQIWLVLQELGLDNLGGIFVVTFAGVALASIACVVELLCVTYQDSAELGTTWWYEIRSGLNICWNIWFFSVAAFRSRTSFAFRCTAFGRKERMPAIKIMRRWHISAGFNAIFLRCVQQKSLYQSIRRRKRKGFEALPITQSPSQYDVAGPRLTRNLRMTRAKRRRRCLEPNETRSTFTIQDGRVSTDVNSSFFSGAEGWNTNFKENLYEQKI